MKKRICVYVEEKRYEKLAKLAEAENRSISAQLDYCLKKYIEKHTISSIPLSTSIQFS